MTQKIKLDIIIPVYNEGSKIVNVMKTIKSCVKTPFKVLICYDHDNDNTLEALRSYKDPGFEIMLAKNAGAGVHGAIMTGFQKSSANAVLVYPADDTHNADIIDTLYEKYENGYDIVAASRFVPGGCMKGAPWLKSLLVMISSFTLYHFAGMPIHDASNGFRLFSRKVLDNIKIESSLGFIYSIELLVKGHRMGYKICEVPSQWFERTSGKSRFRLTKWVPHYLRWYFYGFATTMLGKKKTEE